VYVRVRACARAHKTNVTVVYSIFSFCIFNPCLLNDLLDLFLKLKDQFSFLILLPCYRC